jgi:hypothetical protein
MGIHSFFGIKPHQEDINPKFNFISGEYIYDSNDFEVIARVDDNHEVLYLMQNKLTGDFFRYKEDLDHPRQPSDQLNEIDRSRAMKMYLDLKTWENKVFTKTYEEAFNIKLKRFGEETTVNKDKPVFTTDDTNFLEVV